MRSAQVQATSAQSAAVPGQIVQADKHAIGVQTGEGILLINTLQLPGKKPLATQDILNGHSDWFSVGTILS